MNKEEYIAYWIKSADMDWKRANLLFKNSDFVFALFCSHLCLEKLLKASWVKANKENIPPRIHNLVLLIDKTNLKFEDELRGFLEQMNSFQLEGRYPDYQFMLYHTLDKKTAMSFFALSNKTRKWLLKNL